MWREPQRRIVLCVVALAVAGCTNGTAETTTTTVQEPTTTTAVPTTTTTTSPAIETTSTTEFTDMVGSPQMLAELVNEANANSRLAYGAEIPADRIPDLTAANPTEAVRGLYELEAAIVQTAPVDQWFEVLVYPESPVSFQYLSDLQTLSGNRLVAVIDNDGYVVHDTQLAGSVDIARVPDDIQAGIPAGSATVIVTSSSGPIHYVDPDGEVVISNDGWSNRARLVVVSPTNSGWKLYWAEDV